MESPRCPEIRKKNLCAWLNPRCSSWIITSHLHALSLYVRTVVDFWNTLTSNTFFFVFLIMFDAGRHNVLKKVHLRKFSPSLNWLNVLKALPALEKRWGVKTYNDIVLMTRRADLWPCPGLWRPHRFLHVHRDVEAKAGRRQGPAAVSHLQHELQELRLLLISYQQPHLLLRLLLPHVRETHRWGSGASRLRCVMWPCW